jgi:hypothetical protein
MSTSIGWWWVSLSTQIGSLIYAIFWAWTLMRCVLIAILLVSLQPIGRAEPF